MTSHDYRTVVIVHGRPAQARIHGVLRGGHVYEGVFYAPAATNVGVLSAPVETVTELKYHDEEAA